MADMPPLSGYINANGYNAWCSEQGYHSYGYQSYGCAYIQDWVNQLKLEARPADEPDWPGMIHLAQLFIGDPPRDETYNENFWPALCPGNASALRLALAERYATESMSDHFEIDKVVAGRWRIIGQQKAAQGYFNLGIFYVAEMGLERGRRGVLKLLPTEAMRPGMSVREIKVHSSLNHPAIVELYDSYLPTSCHEVPWIITEYCNLRTLEEEIEMHMADGTHATEHYMWEVFVQLLRAVHYCHHGPGDTTWDPINHRDIILTNVFQKTADTSSTSSFANIIKLGDFGCAMPLSEMMHKQPDLDSLPEIDGSYCPPEGPVASERGDVYQVGLIMFCIYCEAGSPSDIPLDKFTRREWQPWWCDYSELLKTCIIECLHGHPTERPSAGEILTKVSRWHSELLAAGKLKVYV